jgi:cellulose synthase/poly-beta-1,6-N-acetylglucosamine synthase-like glycosyltransferase
MESIEAMAAVCLWGSFGLIAYVYVGYPLTLMLLPARPVRRQRPEIPPRVTVVIAAYNEVRHIAATVKNKLDQSYPPDRLDVVVVSDGSGDGTDNAVIALQSPRVTLLRQEPRQGKTMALNRALSETDGELVVFSDANSIYAPDTVQKLVASFEDPAVGYVTGDLLYRDPGETAVGAGSGVYMRYESWLRRLESRVGSVVGVNGGIDAVRRSLYEPMRADHLPDFVLPLRVAAGGHRVVFCEDAVSTEEALGRQDDEYRMRVRVSLRALHTLAEMRSLLHPRYGLLAFELLVHKLLRYLVALPLAAAFVSSAILAGRPMYALLLAAQSICYVLAAIGWIAGGRIRWKPIFVPFYFCLINVAAVAALIRFLRGQRTVLWTPRKGA